MNVSIGGKDDKSAYSLVYLDSNSRPPPIQSLYRSYTILSEDLKRDEYSNYISPELYDEVKINNMLEQEQLND